MPLWTVPAVAAALSDRWAARIDRRTRDRSWSVFFGLLPCRETRRAATAWFRAAGIGADFRRAYDVLGSVGRRVGSLGTVLTGQRAGGPGRSRAGRVRPGRHGDHAVRAAGRVGGRAS